VRRTPAALAVYRKLLDDGYGRQPSLKQLCSHRDYLAARNLCRRNALRVLFLAARGYGLAAPSLKDKKAAKRSTEPATADEGALRRAFSADSEPRLVQATYRNEVATFVADADEDTITHYDGVACGGEAVGGLVYLSGAEGPVYLLSFDGDQGAGAAPPAWPPFKIAADSGSIPRHVPYNQETDAQALAVVCPAWPNAVLFRRLSVVASPDAR
jgi:hypothetical protein